MRFYVETKSGGKCGCGSTHVYITDRFKTKAEARRWFSTGYYGRVTLVLTEEQASGDGYKRWRERAVEI